MKSKDTEQGGWLNLSMTRSHILVLVAFLGVAGCKQNAEDATKECVRNLQIIDVAARSSSVEYMMWQTGTADPAQMIGLFKGKSIPWCADAHKTYAPFALKAGPCCPNNSAHTARFLSSRIAEPDQELTNRVSLEMAKSPFNPNAFDSYFDGYLESDALLKKLVADLREECEGRGGGNSLVRDHFTLTVQDKQKISEVLTKPFSASVLEMDGHAQHLAAYSDGCIDVCVVEFGTGNIYSLFLTMRAQNADWTYCGVIGVVY